MENNFIIIDYLNQNIKILQFISESDYQFNERLLFIKKLETFISPPNNKEAIRLSKIWYSIKFKKCTYPLEIYNNILQYDSNIKIKN